MDKESVTKAYSNLSSYYDVVFNKVFDGGRKKMFELLPREKPIRLLEVGVGTGLSLPYYPKHWEVTGIDLSPEMLLRAKGRVKEMKLENVSLLEMDATKLAFPNASFDAVVAAYVISATPEPETVVREMRRVCKPGGTLIMLNHFLSRNKAVAWVEKKISRFCYRWGFRTDLDLQKLLEEVELEPDVNQGVNSFRYWRLVKCTN